MNNQATPLATHNHREFFVVGVTHIDLAWKRGAAEMTEMLEVFVVRLLDALEREPDFRYMIEQAAHYRTLMKTRPDLVERLKPFVQSGRVEIAGAMASTLEANLPCGESFVRNQSIGLKWVREHFGVEPQTGWLIDTFGTHAQVPQILKQFGRKHLMANRFGGATDHDTFWAHGLDGSEVLVVGREYYSAFVRRENTARVFYHDWGGVDRLFAEADTLPGAGPFLLLPYVENEMILSLRPLYVGRERNAERTNETYRSATPCEYFAALDVAANQTGRTFPTISADLNPEFTGCFSLRPLIRLRNRRAEIRLLEAEKWASLLNRTGWQTQIEAAWWDMAFVQFHDVFTGSHPTAVYEEVLRTFERIEKVAAQAMDDALETLLPEISATPDGATVLAVNGLPWERTDAVRVVCAETVTRVVSPDGEPVAFAQNGSDLRFLATLPAVGSATFGIETRTEPAPKTAFTSVSGAVIENEFIRLEVDGAVGICRLVWKPTGATLIENAGDFLVAQRDDGTFQIESPSGAEVAAGAGVMHVSLPKASPLGQGVRLSGTFPDLSWAGAGNTLTWEADFFLPSGSAQIDLIMRLHWSGEGTRIRLKLSTAINSGAGIFEIPFGTVTRKAYGTRANARGEWPAHRFVAVQDDRHGIALVNTGVGGVETAGGTLWTTLLRAPKTAEIGMIPDDTSSGHGTHEFVFALVPYVGDWQAAGVAARAQEVNNAVQTMVRAGYTKPRPGESHLQYNCQNVVLSAVKAAEDGSGELVVRFYETAGRSEELTVTVRDLTQAWHSDLREQRGETVPCRNNSIRLSFTPFEIKTVRVARNQAA